jgi:hypothetical protein
MGKLNPQKFTTEEFQDQSKWIGKLFANLNQFTGEVVQSFANGLTVTDNLYQEIKEIKYVNSAGNFPLKFKTKWSVYPKGLSVLSLYNNTLSGYSVAAPWVVWSYADGQVIIDDISGLTSGNTYTIRFLVIYG